MEFNQSENGHFITSYLPYVYQTLFGRDLK